MQPWMIYAIVWIVGYGIGSVSFARIVFRVKRPGSDPEPIKTTSIDQRVTVTHRHIGATSVMIAFGRKWGLTTTLVDVLKGFLPPLIMMLLYPDQHYHLMIGIGVLIGHMWPVWYRFKGGGGNSSIMGMILAISPLGLLITHGLGMIIGRFFPAFAFWAGIILIIPWFMIRDGIFSWEVGFSIVITGLYLYNQLPEVIQFLQYQKQGYEFDMANVMKMMQHHAKKDPDK